MECKNCEAMKCYKNVASNVAIVNEISNMTEHQKEMLLEFIGIMKRGKMPR